MTPADAMVDFESVFGTVARHAAPDRSGLDTVDCTGVLRGNADLVSERGCGRDNDLTDFDSVGVYPSASEPALVRLRDALKEHLSQVHGGAA